MSEFRIPSSNQSVPPSFLPLLSTISEDQNTTSTCLEDSPFIEEKADSSSISEANSILPSNSSVNCSRDDYDCSVERWQYTWSDRRPREVLPIDQKLEEILELVSKHRLIICEAETGAGKTTRIAQAALLADPKLHVTMTQPRRNACRWNGRRIAAELGCQPGGLVGWRLAGEVSKVSKATRLTLVVNQTLVNTVRKLGKLPEGLLIVDEAHERSLPLDLLLGLIHGHLASAVKTHILIMSATLNTKAFSKFFHEAPIVHVQGRCYPVKEQITPLLRKEHHTDGALRAAIQVKECFFARTLYVENEILTKGTVIILLPGKKDINLVMQGLLATSHPKKRMQVLACHSQISTEEQNLAQTPVPAGVIRFLCGTDILRSSITVPETRGVIDSLQVKRRITDEKGVTHLDKVAVRVLR